MRTSLNFRITMYLVSLSMLVISMGCTPAMQPGLTFDDVQGDRLTCDGDFGEKISIMQQGQPVLQDVTLQVTPAAGGNVSSGVAINPANKRLRNDMPEILTINGQLQDKCQQGRVRVTARGSIGTAADEALISPVPARITIGNPVVDFQDFSYTVAVQCCAGSGDNVELTFSNGASETLTNIAVLNGPMPTKHSFKCRSNPTQSEQVVITGKLNDPKQSGLTRLIVSDSVNRISCLQDTTIPAGT